MNRREFMRRALGGATALAATAAVAGMALPTDLRPDDVAALMKVGVSYEWDNKTQTLRVTNHTQEMQTVSGVMYGDMATPFDYLVHDAAMGNIDPSKIFISGSDGSRFEWSFQRKTS